MLTSPLNFNHGRQQESNKRRDDPRSKAGSTSEVILILGDPTPGDLSALLLWEVNSPRRNRQRRLLIFASDLRGLSKSALQTPHVDLHILSESLCESSGLNSQRPDQPQGKTIHLVGVLERAIQVAAAWRADVERLIDDGQLAKEDPHFSSRHHSAHSSKGGTDIPKTNHFKRTMPATVNYVNEDNVTKPHRHREHRHAQSNSNSKSTANRSTFSASKGLLPDFLNFNSPSVPRHSSPSIYQPQTATHPGFRSQNHTQYFLTASYARTFDVVLNFLPSDLTEQSFLKQMILVSTLCGQYFAGSEPEIPPLGTNRTFGSRASSSRSSPSPKGTSHPQNLKGRTNSLFPRTPTTDPNADETRRTSTASSGSSSGSGSAFSATSSTPSDASISTTISGGQPKRWPMLSWLSTTSTSQASDPKLGATSVDCNADASQRKTTELRRRLSYLFGRTPKRSELHLNRSPQVEASLAPEGEENDCKRKRIKITQAQQTPHKHAHLIHVLPTSFSTRTPAETPCHILYSERTKEPIPTEPELLEQRRPPPLPLSLNHSSETAGSFTHARMQTSMMRRATVQQLRLRNLQRTPSMSAPCTERGASPTVLNPISRDGSPTKGPVQHQKREKPPLADHIENFLADYFGQGTRGDVLPFVLDAGVFGREVSVNTRKGGTKKRMLVGEAVLSSLFDEFAMNGQCWIGDEDLRCLVSHLRADDDEETEGPAEGENVKCSSIGPKHPPPAAISPSSSEGSEGAGPAASPSPQRSRSRVVSDFGSPVPLSTSKHNVTALLGVANALKAPEPAHIYPQSRPPLISQSLTNSTRDIAPNPANGISVSKLSASKRVEKE